MSMETMETAMTDHLAKYFTEQGGFSLGLKFFGESHTGKREKPCCVFEVTDVEVLHPRLSKVILEMNLVVQTDDSEKELAAKAAREIEAHVEGALHDLCRHFYNAGEWEVRKCRRANPSSEIDGERSRAWGQTWELWVRNF